MSDVDVLRDDGRSFGLQRGESLPDGTSLEVVPRLIELVTSSRSPLVDIRGSSEVRLNDANVSELVGAILVNNAEAPVTSVSLKYNHISDEGVRDIVRLIENDSSCLERLDLEGNDIGRGGAALIGAALAGDRCKLRELNLSWNNLSTDGAQEIASGLETNVSLRVLKVANCGFTYAPLIALYTALKKHPHLVEVDVDRPVFAKYDGDICADHLSVAVLNHPSLRRISARYNKISDYGASLISRSLISRVNMVSIDLSCNVIGVEGAEHLASYVIQSKCIEELFLSSNIIADEGALAMSKAILASNSLKTLVLKNNSIRVEGLIAIGRAAERNNTLQRLHLWGNAFDDCAGRLYHELGSTRFPYTGLQLDFTTYVVDGIHLVAERAE